MKTVFLKPSSETILHVTLPIALYCIVIFAQAHHGPPRIADRVTFATRRKVVSVVTDPIRIGTLKAVPMKGSCVPLADVTP